MDARSKGWKLNMLMMIFFISTRWTRCGVALASPVFSMMMALLVSA